MCWKQSGCPMYLPQQFGSVVETGQTSSQRTFNSIVGIFWCVIQGAGWSQAGTVCSYFSFSSWAGGMKRHHNCSLSLKVPKFAPNVQDLFTLMTPAFAPLPHRNTCPVIPGTASWRRKLLHVFKAMRGNWLSHFSLIWVKKWLISTWFLSLPAENSKGRGTSADSRELKSQPSVPDIGYCIYCWFCHPTNLPARFSFFLIHQRRWSVAAFCTGAD